MTYSRNHFVGLVSDILIEATRERENLARRSLDWMELVFQLVPEWRSFDG